MFGHDTKPSSYIQLPVEKVRELCRIEIARIGISKAKRRSKLISETQKEMDSSWWHRLAGKPPTTQDEAIAYIMSDRWAFTQHSIVHGYTTHAEDRCKEILHATSSGSTDMVLSVEDYGLIS